MAFFIYTPLLSENANQLSDKVKWDSVRNDKLLKINKKFNLFVPHTYYNLKLEFDNQIKFQNYNYFISDRVNCDKEKEGNCADVFIFDEPNAFIKKLTNIKFGAAPELFICFNNLCLIVKQEYEHYTSHSGLLVIPESSPTTYKYYEFKDYDDTYVMDFYTENDKLMIKVQASKSKINWYYYFFFFVPRGRGGKWETEKMADYIYTFDKDFKLINKKEIRKKK